MSKGSERIQLSTDTVCQGHAPLTNNSDSYKQAFLLKAHVTAFLWKRGSFGWSSVTPPWASFRLGLLSGAFPNTADMHQVKWWGMARSWGTTRLSFCLGCGSRCLSVRLYLPLGCYSNCFPEKHWHKFDALWAQECVMALKTMKSWIFHFSRSCWIITVMQQTAALLLWEPLIFAYRFAFYV